MATNARINSALGRHSPWVTSTLLAGGWLLIIVTFGCSPASPPVSAARADQQDENETDESTSEQAGRRAENANRADPVATDAAQQAHSGAQLYARHCAACHGERGDGLGIAARFVFPKPRDLRAGRFRLVSTSNYVPTREDLHSVLLRGMPGSSMPPWNHLPPQDREALVDEILRLRRAGVKDIYIAMLKEEEGYTDEELAEEELQEQIDEYVTESTTPGSTTEVPSIGEPTPAAIAAGKETYAKFSCVQCHGPSGRGEGAPKMVDLENYPTAPRDFVAGVFKGGHDPASLYRRIAYGMPGTPMPSSSQMTPEEMVNLVHYIRSLSTEQQREAVVLNRERIVTKRVPALATEPRAADWNTVPPVSLRTVPIWWREGADPQLQVQAMHDEQAIAVRLTWRDTTPDHHALRSEAFEDAIALELYRGPFEPFIGMGDPNTPADVWFWDADRERPADIEDEYPHVVADIYPFSEPLVESAEYGRPSTRRDQQPPISLPAVAAGNPIVPGPATTGGSNLTVGGPGTVTFRIPQSQHVTARGDWTDGTWAVVMTRPLALKSPEEGVTLAPGDKVSIAFAIWDGAAQDRDGKKLITIWQDLELEP